MSRLLVICGEPIGARMAGPAIRAVELARAVATAGSMVTIAAPSADTPAELPEGVRQVPLRSVQVSRELANHDCVLAGASLMTRFPVLARATIPLAVDMYVPVVLEAARLYTDAPAAVRHAVLQEAITTAALELARADLVLCANPRQRDLWVGMAMAGGRTEEALVKVVPFGVPDTGPIRGPARMRGVVPGIADGDRVLLWAGGLHDWFDPVLLIDAVAHLGDERARLVFLGSQPPNANLQPHTARAAARRVAQERGMLGRSVFFLDGWVPYEERGGYLLESDLGVSAHLPGLETHYSWRTRLLDYAWAGLPLAATGGDSLSELLAQRGAACLSEPGDADGLAAAIGTLLEPDARSTASVAALEVGAELRWSRVAGPLLDWVADPQRTSPGASAAAARRAMWKMLAAKAGHLALTEGPSAVARRARRFGSQGGSKREL